MVPNDYAKAVLTQHLNSSPESAETYEWLLTAIDKGVNVTSRKTWPGHITVGLLLYSSANRTVLQIHHKALDRWLLPGGHVETIDSTLEEAAIRELREETGIQLDMSTKLVLLEIDRHEIPANESKREPRHEHYDFRYLVVINTPQIAFIQQEEVVNHRWVPIEQLSSTVYSTIERLVKFDS